jgi:hypothetical protein
MSKVQVSRQVKFISKAGTYTAMIQCNRGQLWQSFQGTAATPSNITPDYASLQDKPVLRFVVVSSRSANAAVVSGTPKWYFGSAQINSANINQIDTAYQSYFELVNPDIPNGQYYYGLRIKANLVTLAQGSAVGIKAVGTVSGQNFEDTVQAETTVNIYPQTEASAQIDILDISPTGTVGVTGKNFTFDHEDENIVIKVDTYVGGAIVSPALLTYRWEKVSNGAWTLVSEGTGTSYQQLTVNEKDVHTYAKYRCRVKRGDELLGYGKANLMDSTDPYIIEPNPQKYNSSNVSLGTDESIENVGEYVKYTPMIVSRSNPGVAATGFSTAKFNFMFSASDGNLVAQTLNSANGSVTYAMCLSNGNIDVSIESVDDVRDYN